LPNKGHAITDFHLYAMPGAWSQDLPTGWIAQIHLRYSSFDKLFDNHGHAFDPGFKIDSFQWFGKLIYVQRLSEKWQLTNVLTYTLLANAEMDGAASGAGFHKIVTGPGDLLITNFIGRW